MHTANPSVRVVFTTSFSSVTIEAFGVLLDVHVDLVLEVVLISLTNVVGKRQSGEGDVAGQDRVDEF